MNFEKNFRATMEKEDQIQIKTVDCSGSKYLLLDWLMVGFGRSKLTVKRNKREE
jgi:hypothetical protein